MDPAWADARDLAQQAPEALRTRGVSIPPLSPELLRLAIDTQRRSEHVWETSLGA